MLSISEESNVLFLIPCGFTTGCVVKIEPPEVKSLARAGWDVLQWMF